MVTKYCDHGLYGAYAATPTWGVAQDGDGTDSIAATPAVADIVFTGVPAGTISVCGVTVSPTWGASADAAANGLATAINAATGNVTTTGFRASAVQLRNAVYARGPSGGAPAGTCEIMSRHGTAAINSQVAIAHTLTNVDAGASSLSFSGGAGGAWGWLFNPTATIWASAVAIGGYGIWGAAMPYAGALAAGDVVKVRANKTITLTTNANVTVTMAAMGSATAPVVFDIDDGSVWPADGSTPVLKVTQALTANAGLILSHTATTFVHVFAKQYASGQRNLVLEATGNGPTIPVLTVTYGGPVRFDNLDLYCPGTVATASCMAQFKGLVGGGGIGSVFKNFRLTQPGQPPSSAQYGLINQTMNAFVKAEFIGGEFALTAANTAWANGVMVPWSGGSPNRTTLDSCKFTGFVSGSTLLSGLTQCDKEQALVLRNCDLGNITNRGPYFLTFSNTNYTDVDAGARGVYASSQYGNRDFFIERPGKGFCEWNPAKGYPTLNARLHDGTTPWVIYACTGTSSVVMCKTAPFDLPRIAKVNSLADGVRTLTLNFLLESTLSWNKSDISVLIEYENTNGDRVVADSYDPLSGALSSSTAAWSSTSYNGQTWAKKEFSVTTPDDVKTGGEIAMYVRLHTPVANNTLGVIIDPEILVS